VRAWPIVFAAAAWLFLAGLVVQVFLAGLGVFVLTDWTAHTELGWGLSSASILLLVLAVLARPDRRTVWLTAGLAVAALVQPELAAARDVAPLAAALHPVNALVVFWLAWLVARGSVHHLRRAERHGVKRLASSPPDAPPAGGTA
jgi:hypothetical protein